MADSGKLNEHNSAIPESECTFYDTIRSGDVQYIENLISKCTIKHSEERVHEMLSQAYGELKMKNVPVPYEMQAFVESRMIRLRFFSDKPIKNKGNGRETQERIKLLTEAVELLISEYSDSRVDEKFLFITKFVARNIHILKRRLESSYIVVPWEEIEFCLVSFASAYASRQENNLYYSITLTRYFATWEYSGLNSRK